VETSNAKKNLEKLEEIRKKNPSATHIYMRRIGKDNLIVDIPMDHAVFTIRQWPLWELVASNKDMDDDLEETFDQPDEYELGKQPEPVKKEEELEVPPKPSEVNAQNPWGKSEPKKRGRPAKKK
jgi:hypothetical protein